MTDAEKQVCSVYVGKTYWHPELTVSAYDQNRIETGNACHIKVKNDTKGTSRVYSCKNMKIHAFPCVRTSLTVYLFSHHNPTFGKDFCLKNGLFIRNFQKIASNITSCRIGKTDRESREKPDFAGNPVIHVTNSRQETNWSDRKIQAKRSVPAFCE